MPRPLRPGSSAICRIVPLVDPTVGAADHVRTVLVVDDDEASRTLLTATLESDGFEAVEAGSGDEALRLLAGGTFDAVLLDRSMPGMDGNEVLDWIRRSPTTARLPVIMVTGRDDVADRVEGLESGADDYIVKPFEPDELMARLRTQLRGRLAWTDLVAAEVERRASLVDAARSVTASGPLDQSALQLCDGLVRSPEVRGAAFVEVVGDSVVPLAAKGLDVFALLADESPGSAAVLGRRLASRARRGAWVETAVAKPSSELTPVAIAPVDADGVVVGLLLAVPATEVGRSALDHLLAMTIDFATLAAGVLGPALRDTARRDTARKRFIDMVDRHEFTTVFQPIVDLGRREVVGYEALTRFPLEEATEQVFTESALVGAGVEVEVRTLEAALAESRRLPSGVWLSVNVSPSLVNDGDVLRDRLSECHDRLVIIELSELEPVTDYDRLRTNIQRLGTQVQLSVDDAGSGFASLAHILALGAEFVKLDRSWVRGLDHDPAKRALVAGIQNFAAETGAIVIAEGIETEAELVAVKALGIQQGQGYLLGHPEPV